MGAPAKAMLVALVLAIAAPVPDAGAALVGEFNARLKDVRTWGAYTAVLESRVYETDGRPPPDLAQAQVHFPRGAALRRPFLTDHFFCDPQELALTRDARVCRRSHFGSGEMVLDGRPWIADPVHVSTDLYLGSPSEPGAVAAIVVLVTSNQRSHAYDWQVHQGNLFRESGRFGHRLDLPVNVRPVLPHVRLRLAELSLRVKGLHVTRRVRRCVRRASGRCLARRTQARKLFWTRTPACRRGRKVAFGADYAFEGRPVIRKRRRLSCSRFLRRPSAERRGTIPGT
jgi:hypothetical protein